ncbi:hypothetical protein [Streptomyces sp. NPDC059256]|uniref:SCO2584 family spore wall biosynthesis protein n=1 Tax=Streptomyces sp. NPDC059256 TaxID=3346794 RepID=UPI00368680FD
MPDDVGGRPFPDDGEPDDDRGGADENFASVVFDEDFVRAAEVHEPSAVERLLAAAQARAEAEAARAGPGRGPHEDDPYEDEYGSYGREGFGDEYHPDDDESGPYGRHGGALRPYRGSARWHRPVAWVLALLMGIGMVALAFTAVYRGSAGNNGDQVPAPTSTGVDSSSPSASPDRAHGPAGSADVPIPPVPVDPGTP